MYAVNVPVFTFTPLLNTEPFLKIKFTDPCVCNVPALGPDPATIPPLLIINEPELNVKVFEPGLNTPPVFIVNALVGENVTLFCKVIFPVPFTFMLAPV